MLKSLRIKAVRIFVLLLDFIIANFCHHGLFNKVRFLRLQWFVFFTVEAVWKQHQQIQRGA